MSCSAVLGTQWGDEGKGKIVDMYSRQADVVVRYQGGHNAGHTVWVNGVKYILRLIPSGIIHENTVNIIGNGTVVELDALFKEINELKEKGIDFKNRFFISERAHIIMPYHIFFDKHREELKGANKIGTTGRGIGPAYMDKIGRNGIRISDLFHKKTLEDKIKANIDELNKYAVKAYGIEPMDLDEALSYCNRHAEALKEYAADTAYLLNEYIASDKKVMLEGAQGTMLDVDFGTYPFVTSSNGTAGGACTGTGISPRKISRIAGVMKAYTTRVGSGPFPTELFDKDGEALSKAGNEFGAVTGRPRRCGWLDLVAAKYAVTVNALDYIAFTKMDVLDNMDTVKACVGYDIDGEITDKYPADIGIQERIKPVYKEFKGWKRDITKAKTLDDLPAEAREYLDFVSDYLKTPYCVVSVGTDRNETIVLNEIF